MGNADYHGERLTVIVSVQHSYNHYDKSIQMQIIELTVQHKFSINTKKYN